MLTNLFLSFLLFIHYNAFSKICASRLENNFIRKYNLSSESIYLNLNGQVLNKQSIIIKVLNKQYNCKACTNHLIIIKIFLMP